MKALLFALLTATASAQLPPTVARRLSDLEDKQRASQQKCQGEIREIRKAVGAEIQRHSVDLAKANLIEDAAAAKRIGDALLAGSEIPMRDWLKGRVLVRVPDGTDGGKPFIVFSPDGTTCKLPWGETATVETLSERKITMHAPTCRVYFQLALDRSTAAVMATKVTNDVWLLKPLPRQ